MYELLLQVNQFFMLFFVKHLGVDKNNTLIQYYKAQHICCQ